MILTAVYALYTKRVLSSQEKTLEEIRRQGEAASRAYVVVKAVLTQRQLFALQIANEGKSPATNLRLAIDRDLYQYGKKEEKINRLPLFSKATVSLPPGSRYAIALWTDSQCFGKKVNELCPREFNIEASYESLGRKYEEKWNIDLAFYALHMRPPYEVAESTERMVYFIKSLTEAVSSLVGLLGKRM